MERSNQEPSKDRFAHASDVAELILCLAEKADILVTNVRLQCLLVILDCAFYKAAGVFCFDEPIERKPSHVKTNFIYPPYFVRSVYEIYRASGINSLYHHSLLNNREAMESKTLFYLFDDKICEMIRELLEKTKDLSSESLCELSIESIKQLKLKKGQDQ